MNLEQARVESPRASFALSEPLSAPARYGLAVGAVAVAALVRLALEPWLEHRSPYLMFTASVVLAAAFGGLRPALLASALSLVVGLLFVGEGWRGPSTCR